MPGSKVENRIIAIGQRNGILFVSFFMFILMRAIPWPNWLPVPAKYADAALYTIAGRALIGGALPDSVNQEHPPLAKYIIGVFSVYLKNAYASSLFLLAIVAYASSYLQLLLSEGFTGFSHAPTWMVNFQFAHHGSNESLSLAMRVLTPLIVHTSTLASTGYAGCPPNIFGLPFSSIAETVNAPLLLLPLPLLYWLLTHHASSASGNSPARRYHRWLHGL